MALRATWSAATLALLAAACWAGIRTRAPTMRARQARWRRLRIGSLSEPPARPARGECDLASSPARGALAAQNGCLAAHGCSGGTRVRARHHQAIALGGEVAQVR